MRLFLLSTLTILLFSTTFSQQLFSYDKNLLLSEISFLDSLENRILCGDSVSDHTGICHLTNIASSDIDTLRALSPFQYGFWWGFCVMSAGTAVAVLALDDCVQIIYIAPPVIILCSAIFIPESMKGHREDYWMILLGNTVAYAASLAIFLGGAYLIL
jgi:hypothetical protein